MDSIPSYPINLNLAGVPVALIGGGVVASHKIVAMVSAGAAVTVVAPEIHPTIRSYAVDPQRARPGTVTIIERPYRARDLDGKRLVLTCTDDPDVNHQVWLDAQRVGLWCNSADDPPNCDWTLPAVVRSGVLQITVSTAGKSPAAAKWLRMQLEAQFRGDWDPVLAMVDEVRAEVRALHGTTEGHPWLEAFDDGVIDQALRGDVDGARSNLRARLGLDPLAESGRKGTP